VWLKAIFQMQCSDFILFSDETWKAKNGALISNNLFYGEAFDNTVMEVFVAACPKAEFLPQAAPKDKILEIVKPEKGFVPHTAPFAGGGGGPAWGCAVVTVPWNLYRHYSHREIGTN